jgi:hypothetical protein
LSLQVNKTFTILIHHDYREPRAEVFAGKVDTDGRR